MWVSWDYGFLGEDVVGDLLVCKWKWFICVDMIFLFIECD